MVAYCHRCAGALQDGASFCPHCAAPQLRIPPPQEAVEAAPGPIHSFVRDNRSIDWRNVIHLALWIAIPAGILAPFFFPLVMVAPVIVISLYQRHRPGTLLDGRSGFRIGALTGLLSGYVAAFGLAGWQLFERYSLHQGSTLDAQYAIRVQQSAEATQRMAQGNAMSMQQARTLLDFFLSPDGRAAVTLFDVAALASGIVLLAGFGGMLGARLTRRSAQQH